ncbi:X-ray radiation resistance-associated protein 1 [Salminus brasiliensis]|uniref:X-ray radiation resistance-associated protein 1 n=1 Tax=Salminus brasiliensis TaxID=930266 RepID=UPI003B8340C5
MAETTVYKLDTGESFPSNCFPIRSFHRSKEGAGHWLVAHRRHEEERHRAPREQQAAEHFCSGLAVGSETLRKSEKPEYKKVKCAGYPLNKQLLMAMHCVDKPCELCSVDISERKLQLVEPEGLEEFDSVAYINASDNRLTLEAFRRFSALRELELSLNGLYTLDVHADDYPRLEVLDLSYNKISAEGILAAGLLPSLKVLHLTGNTLQMLPPNMAGSNAPPDELAPQSGSLFQSLEVLMLDDNKLSAPGVFSSLAHLKRLKHLNLEGNYISEVPYLDEIPIQLQNASDLETEDTTKDATTPKCVSDPQMDQQGFINKATDEDKETRTYSKDFCTQFPQLRHLNLANNKIAEEGALLAVALFPMLSELVIHSNPLTTQRSGDPPVLTCFLQDRLGIKIRRKKTTDSEKTHIMFPVNFKKKVKTKIPKVPKVPFVTAALSISENPCTERGNKNNNLLPSENKSTDVLLPCSSQTSSEEWEEHNAAASRLELLEDTEDTEIPSETLQTEEPFFVTEVDLLEHEYQEITQEAEETTQIVRKDTKNGKKWSKKKLTGYEILQDDHLDFDIPEPVGIQHTVKALEHTLKNLLVYRDSKANLDQLQRPYKEQHKRIRNLPSVKPRKPKEEKVKEILTEMKERKTISVVPLDEVMKRKDIYRKEYEEALNLLKDMKRKYKMVHLNAMKQAAQIETDISH